MEVFVCITHSISTKNLEDHCKETNLVSQEWSFFVYCPFLFPKVKDWVGTPYSCVLRLHLFWFEHVLEIRVQCLVARRPKIPTLSSQPQTAYKMSLNIYLDLTALQKRKSSALYFSI